MVDVRRAYRLVWAYQRRMLDMVEAIVAAFPETTHYHWETFVSEGFPRRSTTDPSKSWSWDALPYYDFSWLRVVTGLDERIRPLAGRWMLQIRHEADDGWTEDENGNEHDARGFAKAENAASRLSIILWKSETGGEGTAEWKDIWWAYSDEWPDSETSPNAIDEDSGLRALVISRDMAILDTVEDVIAMAHEARRRGREELGLDLPELEAQTTE